MTTFTERELDVMSALWQLKNGTVAEVREALGDDVGYTTVLKILQILEEKGAVRHESEGRAYRYHPVVAAADAGGPALKRILDKIFLGSAETMLAHLVDEGELTQAQLQRMRAMLDDAAKRGGPVIGAWMVHGLVVGGLLGGAAALAERALRLSGRAARWTWAAALVGTLALPAWAARTPPAAAAALDLGGAVEVDAPTAATAAPRLALPSLRALRVPTRFDVPLGALWVTLSGAVLCAGAIGLARLARARREWQPTLVDGRDVLLSDRFGPAVMGLLRPEVVLPRWALDLGRAERALVLAHEEEHRRARDPLLLALGAAAVAVAPWNPWAWWGARRLRAAVELDCDARVLARGAEPLAYGELLLRVGTRTGRGVGVLAAALTENSGSILERRLTMITRVRGGAWRSKAVVTGAAAAALIVLACETPSPTTTDAASAVAQAQREGTMKLVGPNAQGAWARPDEQQGPLVFIDGVDVTADAIQADGSNALENLRPEMIKRIEVIKGAAALEIFGERGKNGVIQVFTKEGAEAAGWKAPLEAAQGEAPSWNEVAQVAEAAKVEAAAPQQVERPRIRLRDLQDPTVIFVVDGKEIPFGQFNGATVGAEHMEVLTGAAAAEFKPGATKVVRLTTRK